jgi:hypothetical protein
VFLPVSQPAARGHPWSYIGDVLDQLGARSANADVSGLLLNAWAVRHARID